jgi:hypothetical protein
MTASREAIDGTAEDVGTDLVQTNPAPAPGLFGTTDPVQVVEEASRVADALKQVLKCQGLTTRIQGRDHVRVEGWTTLGAMLGVVPVVVWTRPTEKGWEARVEARTLDSRVIGAAEAECLRDEKRWRTADDYAVRSMAQTRATSKALRGPLGFVVTLAGFEATPEEEMPREAATAPHKASKPSRRPVRQPGEALAELTKLLAVDDELQGKRQLADEGMRQFGASASQRLREILVSSDADALDALLARVNSKLEAEPAPTAVDPGGVEEW